MVGEVEVSESKVLWVVGAAIVDEQGRIFAAQRPEGGAHALEWEFPGGKVEAGESPQEALARELHEELGVEVDFGQTPQFLAGWSESRARSSTSPYGTGDPSSQLSTHAMVGPCASSC